MISINLNPTAVQGLQALNAASRQLTRTETAISTGTTVATPADNPADWAIAQTMRAQASGWRTISTGLQRAQSITSVAVASTQSISDILDTMKADVVSLNDPSLDATTAANITANIQLLASQIDQTADGATYNGVNLLVPVTQAPISLSFPSGGPNPNLSFSSAVDGQPGIIDMTYSFTNVDPSAPDEPTLSTTGLSSNTSLDFGAPNKAGQTESETTSFQYGDWSDFSTTNPASVSFDFSTDKFPTPAPPAAPPPAAYGVSVQSLTLTPFKSNETVLAAPDGDSFTMAYLPMTSSWLGLSGIGSMSPDQMMTAVDNAIDQVASGAAQLGSSQDTLNGLISNATRMQAAITTGVGTLVDADMATESASLQVAQSKQQLAATSLSIANAQPQMLLSLFH